MPILIPYGNHPRAMNNINVFIMDLHKYPYLKMSLKMDGSIGIEAHLLSLYNSTCWLHFQKQKIGISFIEEYEAYSKQLHSMVYKTINLVWKSLFKLNLEEFFGSLGPKLQKICFQFYRFIIHSNCIQIIQRTSELSMI